MCRRGLLDIGHYHDRLDLAQGEASVLALPGEAAHVPQGRLRASWGSGCGR